VPGPGKYDLVPSTGRQFKICQSNHLNSEDVKFVHKQGPGSYRIQKNDKGPAYTIGTRRKDLKVNL